MPSRTSCSNYCKYLIFLFYLPCVATAGAQEQFSYGFIPASAEEKSTFQTAPRYRAFIPESIDLRKFMPKPGNQGNLNSCVGWAVGYAARSYYASKVEGRSIKQKKNIPSPSFIYHATRGRAGCKEGIDFPAALRLLEGKGAVSLADAPYSEVCKELTSTQIARAGDFKISYWQLVNHKVIDDVKGQLARGNPVVFGISVGTAFERLRGNNVYGGEKKRVGGHALTAIGYDDSRQALIVMNSWGRSWGNAGYGLLAYDEFTRNAREAYVMTVVPSVPDILPADKVDVAIGDDEPGEMDDTPAVAPVAPKPKVEISSEAVEIVVPKIKPDATDRIELTEPITDDSCSRVTRSRVGGKTEIRGFVGTQAALERLRTTFSGEESYEIDVALRPWPQCEVLLTLDKQLKRPDAPSISTSENRIQFALGDSLKFEIKTPKTPSYLYVSYIQADGSVVNITQPIGNSILPTKSEEKIELGGDTANPKLTVTRPLGHEMVVVLAANSPLFDGPLPKIQSEREFLTAVRKALIYKADPILPDRIVSAAALALETKEMEK
jgi:hypothetical protein